MRLVVIYTLEMSPNRDVEDHLPPKLVDLSSPNSHETQLLQLTTSTTIHLKTKNFPIFYVVQKNTLFFVSNFVFFAVRTLSLFVYYKQTMNQTNQCQPKLGPSFDDNHKLPKPNSQIYHNPKTPKILTIQNNVPLPLLLLLIHIWSSQGFTCVNVCSLNYLNLFLKYKIG